MSFASYLLKKPARDLKAIIKCSNHNCVVTFERHLETEPISEIKSNCMTLSLAFEIDEYLSLIQVKKRYDGTAKLWSELPTDAELSAKQNQAEGSSEVHMRIMIVCHN